ncbi:MAG TPA: FtsX-like permease family protein [Ktedonobacteraceae bacterium]
MSMISVSTRKAIADVTRRKGRTILMILGIFIGVLSLTAINGANDLFSKDLQSGIGNSFDLFFSLESAPPALVTQMEHTSNVAAMQPRTAYKTTWHLAGNGGTTPFQILGYQDLQHVQAGTLHLISGRLPGPGEIAMDTSDTAYSPVALSDTVTVNTPNRHTVSLRVVGLIRSEGMAVLIQSAQGYMRLDAFQQVVPVSETNQVQQGPPVVLHQFLFNTRNRANNEQTFYAIQSELTSYHVQAAAAAYISQQTLSGAQLSLNGLSIVFLSLAGMALLLTCLMILTTMNNMLTEQFKTIGTMKAIGATSGRIMRGYLLTVGIYALIGTVLGLALGLFLCTQISNAVAQQTKIDLGPYQPAPGVILVSLAAGLVIPELAALLPLWIGTRITVHQAMASYGINTGNSQRGRSGRQRIAGVSQIVWLSLRGIFRKPARAILTILALTLSTTAFMAAQTINNSLGVTAAATNSFVGSDFEISLGAAPIPYQQIGSTLSALPNVAVVEPFDHADVAIASHQTRIYGIPASTHFYIPHVIAGRWLNEHEFNTLVISDITAQRLNAHVGDNIRLTMGSSQMSWRVVGIVHDLSNASATADPYGRIGSMFTTLDNLDVNLRHIPAGSASMLELKAHDHSQAALESLHGEIQQAFLHAKLWEAEVRYSSSGADLSVAIYALFDTIAIIVALVGLLGLSNTLAAEVLERRKEIGILRSLGATGRHVGLIFWVEGLALALIAWIPGFLLAIPGSYALIGVLNADVQLVLFALNPVVIPLTLLFIVIVSFLASFGPALRASRVRIGEILRYE